MKRQSVGALLISDDVDWRWHATDRGIHWIATRYVLARVEVFKRPPKVTQEANLGPKVRKMLDKLRAEPLHGVGVDSLFRTTGSDGVTRVALVRSGKFYIPVNAACLDAWKATGLDCRVSHDGTLLWYGDVRGKPALFGVVMPMFLGRYSGVAVAGAAA